MADIDRSQLRSIYFLAACDRMGNALMNSLLQAAGSRELHHPSRAAAHGVAFPTPRATWK